MKLTFVDLNKGLCKKVKEVFNNCINKTDFQLDVYNGDIFDYKKNNPDFKVCTASNPQFSMGGGLDKAIKDKYYDECSNLKEFVWTDNLFPLITVDDNIKSSRQIIRRAFVGIFAYRYNFDFIISGFGTSIGGLSEDYFISELKLFLSANLSSADLRYADLRSANLSSANLRSADLRSANLSSANLRSADLSYANLRSADLSSADLRSANLSSANLRSADLSYANLSSADLSYAKITNIIQNELTCNLNLNCPEEGDFIGWKKCRDGIIVKLLIPSKAKRSSATSRKCRADYVKTLEIIGGSKVAYSSYKHTVKYEVGKITKCDKWEKNRWIECGGGIHFFITRLEAEQYNI